MNGSVRMATNVSNLMNFVTVNRIATMGVMKRPKHASVSVVPATHSDAHTERVWIAIVNATE